MIKAFSRIECHSQLFHHVAGPDVLLCSERNNRLQLEEVKGIRGHGPGAFCGEPVSPGVGCQAPADFYTGSEMCLKGRNPKANVAQESMVFFSFHSAQSITILIEMGFDSVDQLIALVPREQLWHELHDAWIGIYCRKRLTVRCAPWAENQPIGCHDLHKRRPLNEKIYLVSVPDHLGLYISVPFCKSKCTYCNFASGVFPLTYMERYIDRISNDLRSAMAFSLPQTVDSIYLGGGTPSLLPPEQFQRLFRAMRNSFDVAERAEITVECAPGQVEDGILAAMADCGVNRISFGVQSFIDQEAKATGRLHTRVVALEDIHRVRQARIARVNVDLIAGLPHQTAASWQESLAVLADTGVDHVSIYMLEVDDDSRLGREVLNGGARYYAPTIPTDDAIADMYLTAIEELSRSGLKQYEISNFARDGAASSHNEKYWLRRPYLGLGVDAHSMLHMADGKTVRFATTDDLEGYLQSPGWHELHALTPEEKLEEAWFLGLRRNVGVHLHEIEREFGRKAVERCRSLIDELRAEGLLDVTDDQVSLSARGRLLSNDVFSRFLGVAWAHEPVAV